MEQLWAPWRLEYVQHADEQDGCVFCRAAEGDDEEQLVVHRGASAFVLLNRFPYASGHLMAAPYRHGSGFDTLADDEAVEVHRLAVAAIEALRTVYGPEGFNVGWNLGRIAGAGIVDHGHVHIVPRWSGDTNFMPVLADVRVIPEHLAASWQRLVESWPAVVPERVEDLPAVPAGKPEPIRTVSLSEAARHGNETAEHRSGEMLERRSGTDRRSGSERRDTELNSAAARVFAFLNGDRRNGHDRRTGLDRRSVQPATARVRRR